MQAAIAELECALGLYPQAAAAAANASASRSAPRVAEAPTPAAAAAAVGWFVRCQILALHDWQHQAVGGMWFRYCRRCGAGAEMVDVTQQPDRPEGGVT